MKLIGLLKNKNINYKLSGNYYINNSVQQKNEDNMNQKEEEPQNSIKNIEIKTEEQNIEQPIVNISKPGIESEVKIQADNYKGKSKEGFDFYESGIIHGTKDLKEKETNDPELEEEEEEYGFDEFEDEDLNKLNDSLDRNFSIFIFFYIFIFTY